MLLHDVSTSQSPTDYKNLREVHKVSCSSRYQDYCGLNKRPF